VTTLSASQLRTLSNNTFVVNTNGEGHVRSVDRVARRWFH